MIKTVLLAAAVTLVTIPGLSAYAVDGPILGAAGGADYDAHCPGGFLTGIHARAGSFVDSMYGHCTGGNTVSFGGSGGDDKESNCPAGEKVTGIGVAWGWWVDSVYLVCQAPHGSPHALSPVGGSGGSNATVWQCPNGTAAVSMRGGAGQFVNRIGLVCEAY